MKENKEESPIPKSLLVLPPITRKNPRLLALLDSLIKIL